MVMYEEESGNARGPAKECMSDSVIAVSMELLRGTSFRVPAQDCSSQNRWLPWLM
jgi:hypothetical protein